VARSVTIGWCGIVAALALGIASCNRDQGPDPASANMAPDGQAAPGGQPGGQLAQNEAPLQNAGYQQELSEASEPPPPLPSYSQPECPGENDLWTPGYWAYSPSGYYWVPGTWVAAPYVGALWTPPYWDYDQGRYRMHSGYWGRYVGFYGGVNYGFGYTGRGYSGGYWQDGSFAYNRAAVNVNTRVVRNVYERSVVNYTPVNRISYNGGQGGLNVRPVAAEEAAYRARRMQALPVQVQQSREASANRAQFASENRGRPAIAAGQPVAGAEGKRFGREAAPVNAIPQQQRGEFGPNNVRPAQPLNLQPAPQQQRAAEQFPQGRQGVANRQEPQQMRPEPRPVPMARQEGPQMRQEAPRPQPAPLQMRHEAPQQESAPGRPSPFAQGQPAPHQQQQRQDARPAPESRGPAPQIRQEPSRPAPENRAAAPPPQQRQDFHPAPEGRGQAPPQGRPGPEARPPDRRDDHTKHQL
jgi:hypothetical protein